MDTTGDTTSVLPVRPDGHDRTASNGTAIDEVGALFSVLSEAAPDAPTACAGWTADDLTAHLAAGATEEADLIEAHLAGDPPRDTRALDERERPYRAMPDPALRELLIEQGARLTGLIDRLRTAEGGTVDFTGRPMSAADFAMHSRSECAIHRWDLVGSDAISRELLAQPSLTRHAVGVLNVMTLAEAPTSRARAAGALAGDETVSMRVRAADADDDDLVVTAQADAVRLALAPRTAAEPALQVDAADRLLLLWGRRPTGVAGVTVAGDAPQRALVAGLFGLT